MNFKKMVSSLLVLSSLISMNSYAGVLLSGTRLIFNGNKNEATMTITNPDKKPYLIQSWISKDDKKTSEFIVTPPLFKMGVNSTNTLRIVYAKNNLPQNQESLFWLNVKAIPPSDADAKDSLLIALNTKIKLIYRPSSLIGDGATNAYKKLTFNVNGSKRELVASNPTPYYVNLSTLSYNGYKISDPSYIAPYSSAKWSINSSAAKGKVQWSSINDFGGITPTETATAQ